jgi:hypothetical protein
MSVSPNNAPKEAPSAAEMSEQLSSLIGLSSPSGMALLTKSVLHNRTKSSSPNDQSSVPFVGPDSHTNGSASKTSTSSSPSREVEEILSPKISSQSCKIN